MLHTGENLIDGILVEVVRKRIRRINLRVTHEGVVRLSIPVYWATLRQGEEFLKSQWQWVLKKRAAQAARTPATREPLTEAELAALKALLSELNATWAAKLGEAPFTWTLRKMKTVWGSCHWAKRHIVYNVELARAPRELVEYVVVHELTHFKVHGHGPRFYAYMDAALPDWKTLRSRLNKREW